MERSQFITAVLFAALMPVAACNSASNKDLAARSTTTPADESAVATSGTLSVEGAPLDDATVTRRIQAKYFLDSTIKGRRIQVDTQAGIVTLRGEVASDNERAQALLIARTTEGAEGVEDALTVNAGLDAAASSDVPVPARADDEALTALVQSRLGDDASLKGASIDVTAKDGVLLLDGAVPTAAVKLRALSVARGTDGVVQVVDRIRVGRR
jgi:hyperosmotically inducible periplasmic protein